MKRILASRQSRQRSPLLLFIHVPKTAGTTMNWLLWQLYRSDQVFVSEDPYAQSLRLQELNTLLATRPESVRVIRGHFGLGYHSQIKTDRPIRHFTILRHPIARSLSHFHYDVRYGKTPANTTLASWLSSRRASRHNTQAKQVCGELDQIYAVPGLETSPDYVEPDDLLRRATNSLENDIDAFGLTERFDETLMLLRAEFAWPLVPMLYVKRNVNERNSSNGLDRADVRRLHEANEVDLELYQLAEKHFQERIDACSVDFQKRLQRFRRLNAAQSRIRPAVYPIARPCVKVYRRLQRALDDYRASVS